jgi:hypothetical protein
VGRALTLLLPAAPSAAGLVDDACSAASSVGHNQNDVSVLR